MAANIRFIGRLYPRPAEETIMTPRELEEYRALRETIRERGTARVWIVLAGLTAWAALVIATTALAVLPDATFLPLLVLAATFEIVFLAPHRRRAGRPLHPGVLRRRGRRRLGARGDGVRPRVSRQRARPALWLLFLARHRSSTSSRRCSPQPAPVEWMVVGAVHALLIVRIAVARRQAARQRAIDLERFERLKATTRLPRERDRHEQRVLRALPGVGRIERLGQRVRVVAVAAAADGDRRNPQADRQVRVGRPLATAARVRPSARARRRGPPERSARCRTARRPDDRRRVSSSTVTMPGLPHRRFSSTTAASTAPVKLGVERRERRGRRRSQVDLHPRLERDRVHRRAAADPADVERRERPARHLELG